MTAVEWLVEQFNQCEPMYSGIQSLEHKQYLDGLIEQAKQMEKEKIFDDLIGFQIYLNNKGLITNHEWDFEKMAKLYVKKEYGK